MRVKYEYLCGCIKDKADKEITNPKKNSTCHEHNQDLIHKVFQCEKCKQWVQRSVKTNNFQYCTDCRRDLGKANYNVTLSAGLPAKRNHDCLHYNDCLDPSNGKLIKNSKACLSCRYYKKVPLDVADYVRSVTYSHETQHNTGQYSAILYG